MNKFRSLPAICTASVVLSAGVFQSCMLPSDEPGDAGGTTSGGSDSAAGHPNGGSTAGTGAIAGVGGSLAGVAGTLGGAGESLGGFAGTLSGNGGSLAGAGESVGGSGGALAGVGGSLAGTAGSIAGTAGSLCGTGGSLAGSAGSAGLLNEAGSSAAGSGGVAGNGGANVAGSDAGGGAAGFGNGGVAGSPSGGSSGSSGSAGAGACGPTEPSCAGTSGAGASSGGGNGGAGGDPSLPLVLSTNLITFPATACGSTPTSSTFTITNPSSVTKTWKAYSVGAFTFSATPKESSLLPGEVISVTVTPPFIALRSLPNEVSSQLATAGLAILEGSTQKVIQLVEPIAGAFYIWTPANLNFGAVRLNSSATIHLTQSGDSSGRAWTNNPVFTADFNPTNWHDWTFTFNATTVGVQTATFTWNSVPYGRPPCTPDTFTATAFVPTPSQ